MNTHILASVFERLSSGQRINRASDDAAGLSLASTLNKDQRVFTQGIRNLNDGLSALSIADSALESLSNIVVRLEELAEQSANGVYGPAQRRSLDAEAQSLSDEYFRIARSTAFNGINLLDGTMGHLRLQAGYGADGGVAAGFGGAIGTGTFSDRTSFSAGDQPFFVTLGDLNGDGFLDAVTADQGSKAVSVLLGKGDGTFGERTSFASGSTPRSIGLGDLNGDAILDMVTADWGARTTSVFIGKGDGTFRERTSYSTGTAGPYSVALGDLNGDAVLDMVTVEQGTSTAGVFIGHGDGTFCERTSFVTGVLPYAISLGDLNGDKILDIVTADAASTASVLLGRGDGSFLANITFSAGISPRSLALGDLNGDGMLDMVTGDFGNHTASVFIGNGNGTFVGRTAYSTGKWPRSVALGDLNGDGVLDLVTADNLADKASIFIGKGDGTFLERTSISTGQDPMSVALGDLNGDGVIDIVAADSGDDKASVFLAQTKSGVAPLLPFDLGTMAGARQALPVFKQKLNQLSAQRGEIGAFQARVQVAARVLSTAAENSAAAMSRIMDADVAQETGVLVRTQILQQAGSAVLAQANQQPQIALTLLRGV